MVYKQWKIHCNVLKTSLTSVQVMDISNRDLKLNLLLLWIQNVLYPRIKFGNFANSVFNKLMVGTG